MHDARASTISLPAQRTAPRSAFVRKLRGSQAAYVLLSPYLVLFVVWSSIIATREGGVSIRG